MSPARSSCSHCAARRPSTRSPPKNGIDEAEAEHAIHDGLTSAVDQAEQDGTLPGLIAPLVRKAAESVSPWLILETLERLGSLVG